jgi:hypothetical protein
VMPVQDLAWRTKLLMLLLWRTRVTLIEGDLQ